MSQKPTAEEKQSRIDLVASLLASGHASSHIHKIIVGKYGCTKRTVDSYIAKAKQILIEESEQPREMHIAMSLEVYRSIIRDENASHSDRISAQSRIDRLLGLEAPRRLAHEGAEGGPIQVEGRADALSIIDSDPELSARADQLAIDIAYAISRN